ncbi:hypothetical protein OBBRIDRAFT_564897 [Obba rivulosa]|uniref:Uncharacterized protein n=1 Tax=Obba rivulosa TaxID=1052685 RepID=A0A8E2B279_9APHY|nr:hypothetical protein OBBRIDRAFT_564897 [Obba rivulosa]
MRALTQRESHRRSLVSNQTRGQASDPSAPKSPASGVENSRPASCVENSRTADVHPVGTWRQTCIQLELGGRGGAAEPHSSGATRSPGGAHTSRAALIGSRRPRSVRAVPTPLPERQASATVKVNIWGHGKQPVHGLHAMRLGPAATAQDVTLAIPAAPGPSISVAVVRWRSQILAACP